MRNASRISRDFATKFACEICGKVFTSKRRLSGHQIGKHIRKVGMKNATIDVSSLSEAQRGYLAGFLDGEGGIQITHSQRPDREYKTALHPAVYFCNTHRGSINTLRRWLGGGSISRRKGTINHNDTYVLTVSGVRSISTLLGFLMPCMIIKVPQAKAMLSYCSSRLTHYRGNDRIFNEKELRLYTILKQLNLRGGAKKRQHTDL